MECVGIVLVSHSDELVKGLKKILDRLNPNVPIAAVGGTDDGDIGTSAIKIRDAINSVYSEKGVIIFFDLGSALMNTELAIEWLANENKTNIRIADSPLVEGSYIAVVQSGIGSNLEEVMEVAGNAKSFVKI